MFTYSLMYVSFACSVVMALLIFSNKRLNTVYPMAYMGMINLTQACLFSMQLVTFHMVDLCDFKNPPFIIEMISNSVFMQNSWLSQKTGLTLVSERSVVDIAGFIKLVDTCITIEVRILEIIFSSGINLDFILTVIDSFNRNRNIRWITNLVNSLALISLVSSIVILIHFFPAQDDHDTEVDEWISRLGLELGYGLTQTYDIWVRNVLLPVEVLFLVSCLLVVIVGITRLLQT